MTGSTGGYSGIASLRQKRYALLSRMSRVIDQNNVTPRLADVIYKNLRTCR
jgi:hypothetical protein